MLQQLFHGSPELEMEFLRSSVSSYRARIRPCQTMEEESLKRKYCGESQVGLSVLLSKLRKIISPFTLFKHF